MRRGVLAGVLLSGVALPAADHVAAQFQGERVRILLARMR